MTIKFNIIKQKRPRREYFKLKIYQLPEISNVKELWLMTKTGEEAKKETCICRSLEFFGSGGRN